MCTTVCVLCASGGSWCISDSVIGKWRHRWPKITTWSHFPFSLAYKQCNGNWKKKNHSAFCFPPLVGSIQAKLQLANACQWAVGCRQRSSTKSRWASLTLCVCLYEWALVCLLSCAFGLSCWSCLAFWFIFRSLCACACTIIKPELSPFHLTTKEHEVEKDRGRTNSAPLGCWWTVCTLKVCE